MIILYIYLFAVHIHGKMAGIFTNYFYYLGRFNALKFMFYKKATSKPITLTFCIT